MPRFDRFKLSLSIFQAEDRSLGPGLTECGAMVAVGEKVESEIAEGDVRSILEVIASSGKFWHEWDKLKRMLSFQLKQVLSEYPEAQMSSEDQKSSLGETFEELVKRLDGAVQSFYEGPPFTLQRICEILLDGRSIYSNLSKLSQALEKNLSVTSTLTVSTDPYPQAIEHTKSKEETSEDIEVRSSSVQNGVESTAGERDEVMAPAEEAEVEDDVTIDMEAFEEIVGASEANAAPNANP